MLSCGGRCWCHCMLPLLLLLLLLLLVDISASFPSTIRAPSTSTSSPLPTPTLSTPTPEPTPAPAVVHAAPLAAVGAVVEGELAALGGLAPLALLLRDVLCGREALLALRDPRRDRLGRVEPDARPLDRHRLPVRRQGRRNIVM